MGYKIIIENIAAAVTETDLRTLVAEHGTVEAIELARDEDSAENTQVAFVDLQSARCRRAAIAALDGQTLVGHQLKVKALRGYGNPAAGLAASGGLGPGSTGRGGRFGVVSDRAAAYGHKGRGKSGGRSR